MNCKYPLHPGQTEVSPYYVQVPMEEYGLERIRMEEDDRYVQT